jgi:hypothetical protein
MSVEAIAWVLNHAPVESPVSKLVLVALANHAHPDGSAAFPSVATICRYTCLSERSVRQHLDNLEGQGIIRRCDPRIVAAYIQRADRRPIGYDIVISGVHATHLEWQRGAADAANGVQEIPKRGAGDAPKPSNKPSNETHTPLVDLFHQLLKQTTPAGVAIQAPTAEWTKSMNRLLSQGATEQQIETMMRLAFEDDWWRKNLRTPMKMEKHWERLVVEKSVAVQSKPSQRDAQFSDAVVMVTNLVRLNKQQDDVMDYIHGKPERMHEDLIRHYEQLIAKAAS